MLLLDVKVSTLCIRMSLKIPCSSSPITVTEYHPCILSALKL